MKYLQKAIAPGYILIVLLIGCIAYTWHHEWQDVEALEVGNQQINEFRKDVNRVHICLIEFSLLGETVLEWDEMDLEDYHAKRIELDSILCLFNATYPIERFFKSNGFSSKELSSTFIFVHYFT